MRVLCLANSYKEGGRCIAGIDVKSKEWVRPISSREGGAYRVEELVYENGARLEVLDVFEFHGHEAAPSLYHPEDIIVDPSWSYVRAATIEDVGIVEELALKGPLLLGSSESSIQCPTESTKQVENSLGSVVLKSSRVKFRKERGTDGRVRKRATFRLRGSDYDLPITDPSVLAKLAALDVGEYAASEIGIESDHVILVVSLAEPWDRNNRCYKVVAAVVPG